MDVNLKVEPSEHPRLSDNDTTPLRDGPATSPKIFVSNATSGTGDGWESDDSQENVVIPKRDPDENYFDDLIAQKPKKIKDEDPPKLEDASIDWDGFDKDWDILPNGFTKREQLGDMESRNGLKAKQAGEQSPELQALLDQEALLLKLTEQAAQEEESSSPRHKKRKKHKKNKSRHHEARERIRSTDRSKAESEEKRGMRHSPSPAKDRESRSDEHNRRHRRRSPSLLREDQNRREGRSISGLRAGISNNNEGEKTYKRRRSSEAQRDDLNRSKRSRDCSRLSGGGGGNRSRISEPEADVEELRLRDDEKGFIRLVDPSKLIQETAEPQPAKLTAQEKREVNIERTRSALAQMVLNSSEVPEEEFLLVDTISKMPNSMSYMTQGMFENPSPLQNNFNVAYKFNSISGAQINLFKWGLESLPKETTKLLNLLGINSDSLKRIEANTVTPQRILKLRKQAAENGELEVKMEDLMSVGTGLYRTMGTQTTGQSSNNTKHMGTQTAPMKENREKYAIWQDPKFDIINLTQTQTNVMLALKELSECMPNQLWAEQLYKPLQNALFIKRNAIKDPRLTRNAYK